MYRRVGRQGDSKGNRCQKAWGAACHADWIAKGLDKVVAHYEKLQTEDRDLEAKIKAAEIAPDYHTVENRNMRKAMQERRNLFAKQMQALAQNMQEGQQAMRQLIRLVMKPPSAIPTALPMGMPKEYTLNARARSFVGK